MYIYIIIVELFSRVKKGENVFKTQKSELILRSYLFSGIHNFPALLQRTCCTPPDLSF